VGGDVTPPAVHRSRAAGLHRDGRRARVQGIVIVEAIINRTGQVENVRVLKGLPMGLDQAAVDAVKRWKFRPAARADVQ
jgi:protein TonB